MSHGSPLSGISLGPPCPLENTWPSDSLPVLWTPTTPPPAHRPHLADPHSVLWVRHEKEAGGSPALLPAVGEDPGEAQRKPGFPTRL